MSEDVPGDHARAVGVGTLMEPEGRSTGPRDARARSGGAAGGPTTSNGGHAASNGVGAASASSTPPGGSSGGSGGRGTDRGRGLTAADTEELKRRIQARIDKHQARLRAQKNAIVLAGAVSDPAVADTGTNGGAPRMSPSRSTRTMVTGECGCRLVP